MIRIARAASASNNRDRLKLEFSRAASLRETYPQLAELRVEFEFDDGTDRTPSPQSFSYFPGARSFFRYACPCHSCSGEFDLSDHVAELAGRDGRSRRSRNINFICEGQRSEKPLQQQTEAPITCPINAQVRVSAVLHATEKSG